MIKFNDIIDRLNQKTPYHFFRSEKGISVKQSKGPCSITEMEANFIYDFIVEHGLVEGYEIGSGTGISSLVSGLGFYENSGHLTTVDSYIEEKTGACDEYLNKTLDQHDDPVGLNIVRSVLESYGIDNDTVSCFRATSPYDTFSIMQYDDPIDYLFIDAEHTTTAFITDLISCVPLLNRKKFAIFAHDFHCFDPLEVSRYCNRLFDQSFSPVFKYPGDHYNLHILTNIEWQP